MTKTKDQRPKTKDQRPKTKYERRKTKDQDQDQDRDRDERPRPIPNKDNRKDQKSVEGTLGMLGTHLPTFAQLEKVWQELSSRNIDPNLQNRDKTRGLGGQNTLKKLSSEPNALYLAYNMPPLLLYLTPPSATLSGGHSAKNTIPDSKEVKHKKGEAGSYFCEIVL